MSWRDFVNAHHSSGEPDLFGQIFKTLGSEIYYKVTDILGSPKAASLLLKDAGFNGVKVIVNRNAGGDKYGRMNYVIFDENDARIIGHTKFFRSKDGEVYGFTDGEKIYLDTKKMKPETPLHEYTHLWTAALKRANPKEWENVKKLFDEVEGLKEEVSKLYPELKGDDLYEEMITTYSGREGAKKLETVARDLAAKEGKTVTESAKAQGFLEKVKTALQKYWKGIADILHIHFTSAEEVADKVLADWAKGVNPKDVKGEEEQRPTEAKNVTEEAQDLGLPLVDSKGKAVSKDDVEEAKWAQEQGLKIDPSQRWIFDESYIVCEGDFDVFVADTNNEDRSYRISYYPKELLTDDGVLDADRLFEYGEEFNEGRKDVDSAILDEDLTEGIVFYNGKAAKDFKKFLLKKVEEDDTPWRETYTKEELEEMERETERDYELQKQQDAYGKSLPKITPLCAKWRDAVSADDKAKEKAVTNDTKKLIAELSKEALEAIVEKVPSEARSLKKNGKETEAAICRKIASMAKAELKKQKRNPEPSPDPMKGMENAADKFNDGKRLRLQKADGAETRKIGADEGLRLEKKEKGKEVEDSEKLFLSLQHKSNNKKEYYDTVTSIAKARNKRETSSQHASQSEPDEQQVVQGRDGQGLAGSRSENVGLLPSVIQVIAEDRRRTAGEDRKGTGTESMAQQSGLQLSSDAGSVSLRLPENVKQSVEDRVVEWSKRNGAYIDENTTRENSLDGKVFGRGIEARVYLSKDKSTVTKFVKYNQLNRADMGKYIDYINEYNRLFPETAYKVTGVSRDNNGTTSIVVEQPFVDGEQKSLADWEQGGYKRKVIDYLAEKGFAEDGNDSYHNDDFYISDLHYQNVLFKDDKPVVIDASIITKEEYQRLQEEEKENAEIDIINSFSKLQPSILKADWSDLKKLVDEFVPKKDTTTSTGTHYHVATDAERHVQADDVVEGHVQKVSEKLGVGVDMIGSADDITNEKVKADLAAGKKVTGWYDEKTGKVYLYMPNVHDTYTAEKTIWHEVVGHKGLRGLFGNDFNKFMRSLWYDIDSPINKELKAYVKARMEKDPLSFYDAIEEYLADAAEKGKGEQGFWNNIKNKMVDLMHEIGYRIAPNVKDVKYLLWLSKNYQKHPNDPMWQMRAQAVRYKLDHEKVPAVAEHGGMFYGDDGKARTAEEMSREDFEEATDGQVHFRTTPSAATAIDRYQKALAAHGYMFTEAHMDNMLALKHLMLSYLPKGTKIEDIDTNENPYVLQNTMQDAMSKVV